MRKFLSIAAILVLLGSPAAYAQSEDDSQASSGSVYSSIAVGMPLDLSSSAAEGMGLTGVSFIEPFVPGLANPAQWGSTVYGMATGGIGIRSLKARDNQTEATSSSLSANYFQIQLPIKRDKLGISATVAPLTNYSFNFIENKSRIIQASGTPDTLNFRSTNNGGGGINMIELGLGWKINSNISVGYAGSIVFASLNNNFTTVFENPDLRTVSFLRNTSGLGFGNRFGALFNMRNLLRKDDELNVGASVMFPVSLNGEKVQETDRQLPDGSIETFVLEEGPGLGDGSIDLPLKINGGVTYQPSRLLSLSAEGIYQQWSQYKSEFDPVDAQRLTDRYKMGLGLRYFPYIKNSDKFFSKFKYRLGASYDTGHLELNGEQIETLMFSFGLGILSPRSNSSVDINFEYGIRGTIDQSLVKENIWGVRLSVNLSELMFFRPKLQ